MRYNRGYHEPYRRDRLVNKKEKKRVHSVGIAIAGIQLIISVLFLALLWRGGLIPAAYIVALGLVLLVLEAVTMGLQFVKGRIHLAGIVLSLLISAVLVYGAVYLYRADRLLADVGGADYKTDNMVVVVKKDDPAQLLADARNYRFGTQSALDQENTSTMVEDVKDNIGREPNVTEYGSVLEMAQALLDGNVKRLPHRGNHSGHTAGVEGTHGQLCTRLTDGLSRDDADCLTYLNRLACCHVGAVTLCAHAVVAAAGQDGADLDLLGRLAVLVHALLHDQLCPLRGHHMVGLHEHIAVFIFDALAQVAPCDTLLQALDFLVALHKCMDVHAGDLLTLLAAVHLTDDELLGDVYQTSCQVTGVGCSKSCIGQTLTRSVG